jgi:hypothetical protein
MSPGFIDADSANGQVVVERDRYVDGRTGGCRCPLQSSPRERSLIPRRIGRRALHDDDVVRKAGTTQQWYLLTMSSEYVVGRRAGADGRPVGERHAVVAAATRKGPPFRAECGARVEVVPRRRARLLHRQLGPEWLRRCASEPARHLAGCTPWACLQT